MKTIKLAFDLVEEVGDLAERIKYDEVKSGKRCETDPPCVRADAENILKACTELALHIYTFERSLKHGSHEVLDVVRN